jgi:hypothetical protein
MLFDAHSGAVMDRNWQDIIEENSDLLVRSIDPTDELLNDLYFKIRPLRRFIESIRQASTPNDKTGRLLIALLDMDSQVLVGIIDKFLDVLRLQAQDHVANVLSGSDGKQPMSEINLKRLKRNTERLQKFIDPFGGLLQKLLTNSVFRDMDYYRVTNKKICDRQAEEIVNIIERKSDCSFGLFKKALIETDQKHVVYILTDGEEQADTPPLCDEDIEALNRCRSRLVKKMDATYCGLLEALVENECFSLTDRQRADIKVRSDANNIVLDIVVRKSQKAFDGFVEALKSTGQHLISNLIRPETDPVVPVPAPVFTVTLETVKNNNDVHVLPPTDEQCERELFDCINGNTTAFDDCDKVDVIMNCIKLRFSKLTLESLGRLQRLLESKSLQTKLTELCRPVLNRFGYDSIFLRYEPQEFDRIRRDLRSMEFMTDAHCHALWSATDELKDIVDVTEDLLNRLTMSNRRKDTVMSKDSNEERLKVMFDIATCRQDSAFDELLDALEATGHRRAAEILRAGVVGGDGVWEATDDKYIEGRLKILDDQLPTLMNEIL